MNKLIIFLFLLFIGFAGLAQRTGIVHPQLLTVASGGFSAGGNAYARTTAAGDTVILQNSPDTLAHTIYSLGADSGYVTGTNYWGDKSFAERYDMGDTGRNIQVVGVMALFGGKVNPASGRTVTFNVWDQGARQLITGSRFYNGFPNNVLDSMVVPITQLGIGVSHDTMKRFFFPAGTGNLNSFFVGYSVSYNFFSLNGDTIGLASTLKGVRKPAGLYTLSLSISEFGDTTLDTLVNVQNATFGADDTWYDNYSQDDSLLSNLAIYPIVITGFPVGTKGVTRNNFTFYGNYPNPASTATNVRFALSSGADVSIQVMDLSGKFIQEASQAHLAPGEHTFLINTSGLAAGDYLYLVRTSSGDGIAGKLTVIK